jgi:hypothetical protein
LTPELSARARLAVKDENTFDFLDMGAEHSGPELERTLIARVEEFLHAMGGMFAFMGSQFRLVATAYSFRQNDQEEMKLAIAKAAEAGLGVIGMKAMGGSPQSNYGRDRQPEDAQVALNRMSPIFHRPSTGR